MKNLEGSFPFAVLYFTFFGSAVSFLSSFNRGMLNVE
jgi:hypothetical protein